MFIVLTIVVNCLLLIYTLNILKLCAETQCPTSFPRFAAIAEQLIYLYASNTHLLLREVRRLLREGANPNLLLKRKGGLSPFHLSVGLPGHNSHALEIVAVLLDSNADPNNRAFDGLTPLHIAGRFNFTQNFVKPRTLHHLNLCTHVMFSLLFSQQS